MASGSSTPDISPDLPTPDMSSDSSTSDLPFGHDLKLSEKGKELSQRWQHMSCSNVLQEALGYTNDGKPGKPVDVIIVAIDVECFEFPPRSLTEFGLAVLDTRTLKNAPGPNGE